jgi:hypothetical protein
VLGVWFVCSSMAAPAAEQTVTLSPDVAGLAAPVLSAAAAMRPEKNPKMDAYVLTAHC